MNLKIKRMLVIWMCVYPLVTGMLFAFDVIGLGLPMHLQTLILTGCVVPAMMFIIVPSVLKIIK